MKELNIYISEKNNFLVKNHQPNKKKAHNNIKIAEIEEEIKKHEDAIKELKAKLDGLKKDNSNQVINIEDIPCTYNGVELTQRDDDLNNYSNRNRDAKHAIETVLEIIDTIDDVDIISKVKFWYSGYAGVDFYNTKDDKCTLFVLKNQEYSTKDTDSHPMLIDDIIEDIKKALDK